MNRQHLALIIFILATIFVSTQLVKAEQPSPTTAKIDTYLEKSIAAVHAPNAQVVVIQAGAISMVKNFGPGTTSQSTFSIGSVSKPLTAYGVLTLVHSGKLKLDDSVSTYLPDLQLPNRETASHITIAELLKHTSGLSTYDGQRLFAFGGSKSIQENIIKLNGSNLVHKPGETYEYSNANYAILGAIIEKVSGQKYADFISENVFRPMGMATTSANHPPSMNGFQSWYGFNLPSLAPYDQSGAPYGFISSNGTDLAHFLINQMDIHNDIARTMLTGGVAVAPSFSHSLGWQIDSSNNQVVAYHSGENADYGSCVFFNPAQQYGVVVLANLQYPLDSTDSCSIAQGVKAILEKNTPDQLAMSTGYLRLFGSVVATILPLFLLGYYRLKPTKWPKIWLIIGLLSGLIGLFICPFILYVAQTPLETLVLFAPDVAVSVAIFSLLTLLFSASSFYRVTHAAKHGLSKKS
jgi:CubicO group peptidase (beta-lactamase class C family)